MNNLSYIFVGRLIVFAIKKLNVVLAGFLEVGAASFLVLNCFHQFHQLELQNLLPLI